MRTHLLDNRINTCFKFPVIVWAALQQMIQNILFRFLCQFYQLHLSHSSFRFTDHTV